MSIRLRQSVLRVNWLVHLSLIDGAPKNINETRNLMSKSINILHRRSRPFSFLLLRKAGVWLRR